MTIAGLAVYSAQNKQVDCRFGCRAQIHRFVHTLPIRSVEQNECGVRVQRSKLMIITAFVAV